GRDARPIHDQLARRGFQRSGAADHDVTFDTGLAHGVEQVLRGAGDERRRTDDGIVSLDEPGEVIHRTHVAFDRGDVRIGGGLLGIARDGGDGMTVTPAKNLGDDLAADAAGGSNVRDLHMWVSERMMERQYRSDPGGPGWPGRGRMDGSGTIAP